MKQEIVYVEWLDSATTDNGWTTIEEAQCWAKEDNNTISQTGFILKQTDKMILLASRVGKNGIVGGIFKIPIQCITTLTFLNPS